MVKVLSRIDPRCLVQNFISVMHTLGSLKRLSDACAAPQLLQRRGKVDLKLRRQRSVAHLLEVVPLLGAGDVL